MKRLEQVGRQPAQQRILLEGVDHPDHRKLTHQKSAEEITVKSHPVKTELRACITAAPEAEHDERKHSRQGPERDLSAVLEHVRVLTAQQSAHDSAIEPEDAHQRLPWRNNSPIS
ncbi:MAG: Uncharacterised protein [Cyanobium sp. ARS6]|nr:MAG: Uncharacterised protein [Cyanobium sp. ARS6]